MSADPTAPSPPRPILKRSAPSIEVPVPRTESKQLLRIDPGLFQPIVRFPSTSSLTCTFLVHSSTTYDRSPIVVAPNQLELPERGCPGRTYSPGEERLSAAKELASRNNGGRRLRGRSPSRPHLRSRVSRSSLSSDLADLEGGDETDQNEGEEAGPSKEYDAEASETPPSSPPSTLSSPRISPRLSLSPSDIASSLTLMSISPRSRPSSPLSFRPCNYMISCSSSPASSCATSPASSRSSSPCRDLIITTPSARRRRSLNGKHRRSRSFINDADAQYTTFADSSPLGVEASDDGCLGGF
ncbi:hypothetical protein EIP86_001963 [Pleurotus ostreatoroseus]|nr:hypothetical protein EIP86_001963 [Pleurotus ostreatoroseus]